MQQPDPNHPQPHTGVFNLVSPVVIAICVVILGLELVFWLASRGVLFDPSLRINTVNTFALSSAHFEWMMRNGVVPVDIAVRFVSYLFVHMGLTHAIFVCVILLSMGKIVGDVLSPPRVLIVFMTSGIMGALLYVSVSGGQHWLMGGYPAVYGLIGTFTYFLWVTLQAVGDQAMKAFSLIAMLMALQLGFELIFGGQNEWVADLGGFAWGFLISPLVIPGGITKLIEKIRRD